MASQNRRHFLQTTTALAAASLATRPAAGRSASDQIVVGLIGCGGRGQHDARLFGDQPNVRVAYVSDVDQTRLQAAAKDFSIDSSYAVADLRRILDDKSVDAVIVATPDHWHSPASILACEAGKHVYVEKPISHNIREGRLLVEAARRNNVHVQHGTQSRSTSMMLEAVQRLREGLIGPVLVAKCWNIQRRGTIGRGEDTTSPATLDYDNWVGPATMIPYRTNRVHNRWTWWYHFGTGDMGNDGVHDIDYTRWGLGVDRHPSRVVALGGKYFFEDDQQFPDTQQVTFEYAPAAAGEKPRMLIYEQRLWSTNYPHHVDSGAEFYGPDGQLFLSRRGLIELRDPKNKRVDLNIEPRGQDDVAHVRNFLAAIRDDGRLNADAEVGHLSTTLCHLGNIATRLGRALEFDSDSEQILHDDEANGLVTREYRDHWGRPREA